MNITWQASAQVEYAPNLPQFGAEQGKCLCDVVSASLIQTEYRGCCFKAPVWALEGGIHFVERVKYLISMPYTERHSGCRAVSLPWRVLKLGKIKEFVRRGSPVVRLSLRLPDRRTLKIDSRNEGDTARVLETIVRGLKK